MKSQAQSNRESKGRGNGSASSIGIFAEQAFWRAAGARLIPGNSARVLKDAAEIYPAWLEAIESARHTIHFESYVIHVDEQGRIFADALIEKAREGVKVRVIYDWIGAFNSTSNKFWRMIVNLQKNLNRLPKILFALAVLSISLVSSAAPIRLDGQSDEKSAATARIGIENFGKVNDHLYRGSLPKQSDYAALVALGVKTVISLRQRPDERVRQMAERAGMRYINVPMKVRGYPPADLAPRFLDLVNNPENWPVYVYCHGGRHRTGVMTAIYRMAIEGWDVQRAYAEMRQYGFYKRWGHGPMKTYVFDYYRQLQQGADQSYRRD